MAGDFEIDVSPDMQTYKALQFISYGEEIALAEFVDNSIQSFLDNENKIEQTLLITISIDTQTKTIIIEDNAAGISRENLQKAMKMGLGGGVSHPISSLSVYGIGLKTAAIWFSDTWELESSYIDSNEKISFSFDLNNLLSRESKNVGVTIGNADKHNHYTKITILNHRRRDSQNYYKDTVLPFLRETFFKFEKVQINVKLDGETLEPDSKKVFLQPKAALCKQIFNSKGEPENEDSKPITWEKKIRLGAKHKNAWGFIRVMEKGSYGQPGIRLLRNNRVIQGTSIKPNLPPPITGTKNKYGAQRIYGEIHLDRFAVDFLKTKFDSDVDSIYEVIQEELKKYPNLIRQAENYRTGWKPSQPSEPNSEEVNEPNDDHENNTNSQNPEATDEDAASKNDNSTPNLPQGKEEATSEDKPIQSKNTDMIECSEQIVDLLGQLKHSKLPNLYKSLCGISLSKHPILMYVGAWSFFESLSAAMGRNKKVKEKESGKPKRKEPFHEYFSEKIDKWFEEIEEKNDINTALEEIGKRGNANKHSAKGQAMTAQQLHNDFEVLEGFIILCLEIVIKKQSKT